VAAKRLARCTSCAIYLLFSALFSARPAATAGSEYYPLAKGSRWTYRVSKIGSPKWTIVTWKITQSTGDARGTAFQVWPTPMQSDDEAMELLDTSDGVKLLNDNRFLLKNPVRPGDNWKVEYESALLGKKVSHSFTVVSVAAPCRVGNFRFSDCAIIEENDEGLNLRTLTTYARGIGPVEYRYHRLDASDKNRDPIQTVVIVSYKLASRDNKP
jgi:hypothetical protein